MMSSACGVEKRKSVLVKMNSPLFLASASILSSLVGKLRIVARILDDELDRHFAGADRDGRRRGGKGFDARNAHELALQFADDLLVGTLALAPGLEDEADESAMRGPKPINGEHVLALRHIHEDVSEPVGIGREIVEIGVFRRVDEGKQHALVFGRRQFPVDRDVEDAGQDNDEHRMQAKTGRCFMAPSRRRR